MIEHAASRVAPEKADFRPALALRSYAGALPEKRMATYQDYRAQWKDPRWQKRRLEIMQRAGFECENCGDKETTLNVHHKRYIKGRKVWEYDDDLLQCLCEPCHEAEHEDREVLNMIIAETGMQGLDVMIGVTCGYFDAMCDIDPGAAYMGYEQHRLFYELGLAVFALEASGMDEWRGVVRRYAAARKHLTPTIIKAIDRWNENPGAE